MQLTTIFYEVDEFCKQFEKQTEKKFLSNGKNKRNRPFQLTLSEVMTICIYYHKSGYKTFKDFYEKFVLNHMRADFRNLVSYNRFLELRKKALASLIIFLQLNAIRPCTGVSFIDSFPLKACHIKRASAHKTFKGLAQKGKTSVGWFYGFKLHVVINHLGEIVSFCITPGSTSDNNENVLIKLTKKLLGKLFGDKGYLVNENIFAKLFSKGIHLITKIRKNMKNKLLEVKNKMLLRKRGIIESVGSLLKESESLEHTRHRSFAGFLAHVASSLIAYNFRNQKPSIEGLHKIES